MAKARPSATSAAARWAKRVERLERSGLSVRTFAAREGLKAGSLSFWKWKLAHGAGRPSPAPVEPLKFVELTTAAPQVRVVAAAFEVILSSGRAVRVFGGFDAAELARLLAVLEEGRA